MPAEARTLVPRARAGESVEGAAGLRMVLAQLEDGQATGFLCLPLLLW